MEEATKAADFLFEGRLVSRDLAATHAIKFPDGSVENYLVSSDEWLGVIQKSLLEQCAGKLYLAENSRSEAGRERSRLAVYVTSPSEADNALVLPEVIRLAKELLGAERRAAVEGKAREYIGKCTDTANRTSPRALLPRDSKWMQSPTTNVLAKIAVSQGLPEPYTALDHMRRTVDPWTSVLMQAEIPTSVFHYAVFPFIVLDAELIRAIEAAVLGVFEQAGRIKVQVDKPLYVIGSKAGEEAGPLKFLRFVGADGKTSVARTKLFRELTPPQMLLRIWKATTPLWICDDMEKLDAVARPVVNAAADLETEAQQLGEDLSVQNQRKHMAKQLRTFERFNDRAGFDPIYFANLVSLAVAKHTGDTRMALKCGLARAVVPYLNKFYLYDMSAKKIMEHAWTECGDVDVHDAFGQVKWNHSYNHLDDKEFRNHLSLVGGIERSIQCSDSKTLVTADAGQVWCDSRSKLLCRNHVFEDPQLYLPGQAKFESADFNEFTGYEFSASEFSTAEAINEALAYRVKTPTGFFDITTVLAHVQTTMCADIPNVYWYHVRCLAWILRNPGKMLHTCTIFLGEQGVGKNLWLGFFGRLLRHYYLCTTKVQEILGKFNSLLHGKTFVVLNEIDKTIGPAEFAQLKGLVTEPTFTANAKYEHAADVPNHCNLMLTTNELNTSPVPIGGRERRFLVLQCTNTINRVCSDFFEQYAEFSQSPGGMRALAAYLFSLDLSKFKPRDIPLTSVGIQSKLAYLPARDKWWYHCLEHAAIYVGYEPRGPNEGKDAVLQRHHLSSVQSLNPAQLSDLGLVRKTKEKDEEGREHVRSYLVVRDVQVPDADGKLPVDECLVDLSETYVESVNGMPFAYTPTWGEGALYATYDELWQAVSEFDKKARMERSEFENFIRSNGSFITNNHNNTVIIRPCNVAREYFSSDYVGVTFEKTQVPVEYPVVSCATYTLSEAPDRISFKERTTKTALPPSKMDFPRKRVVLASSEKGEERIREVLMDSQDTTIWMSHEIDQAQDEEAPIYEPEPAALETRKRLRLTDEESAPKRPHVIDQLERELRDDAERSHQRALDMTAQITEHEVRAIERTADEAFIEDVKVHKPDLYRLAEVWASENGRGLSELADHLRNALDGESPAKRNPFVEDEAAEDEGDDEELEKSMTPPSSLIQ